MSSPIAVATPTAPLTCQRFRAREAATARHRRPAPPARVHAATYLEERGAVARVVKQRRAPSSAHCERQHAKRRVVSRQPVAAPMPPAPRASNPSHPPPADAPARPLHIKAADILPRRQRCARRSARRQPRVRELSGHRELSGRAPSRAARTVAGRRCVAGRRGSRAARR